ncbi:MAG: ribonucleoside-diphosphate reductase subunit alpha [Undibacterium sp.]
MRTPYWLNSDTRLFMSRGYLAPGETVEQRIDDIGAAAERILELPGFGEEIAGYIRNGWISLSSPVWANFGTDRGLPISCNGSYFGDTIESILSKTAEIGMQTKYGAGTSAYLGALRPRGSKISGGGVSNGPVHFAGLIQETADIISQSNVRRGSCAIYLDVEHADIEEFLECREEGNPIQHLSMGVCITDAWMESMIAGDAEKRRIWARILKKRAESGYPYIFWTDTVNNAAPDVYKDRGLKIKASNLCAEIVLASDDENSFVCDLASMNALKYHEWKDSNCVGALVMLLDAVMTEYIDKIKDIPFMKTAWKFAIEQRAIGIGVLGWHSCLQSRNIAFESMDAKYLNAEIFKNISDKAIEMSKSMAALFGEPKLLKDYGRRHMTLMAIAPTTSSSFILGQVSPSIEPENSNYYTKDLSKGKFTYKNPYLVDLLRAKQMNTEEIWHDILLHGGSVQHLDFLSEHEKNVFKTFGEISQNEIVIQAAQRQKYIDQSQSLNLMIHPDTSLKDVNQLMISAWRLGVKTLYYQRSTNPAQEFARSLLLCSSCEA